jgi:hypothetical protein
MFNTCLHFLGSISQCFNKELCYIFASVINAINTHMNTPQYSLRNANSTHNSGNVSIQFNYNILTASQKQTARHCYNNLSGDKQIMYKNVQTYPLMVPL